MLKFDAKVTRMLDNVYQGADVIKRRRASFDAVNPAPGETILDIGCGNGLLTAELARAVGPQGRVIGIDPSDDMRAAAVARCKDYGWTEFAKGFAHEMPVPDGIADKAVSVQVFEYIDDLDAALADALRCVKSGGRLVISDLHFDSLVWFSDNPDRMNRIKTSWDEHFAAGDVPATITGMLKNAGHVVEDVVPLTLTDHVLKPDGLAMMMMHLMKQFAIDKGHLSKDEANGWFDEQKSLARDGRFFFSISQFVVVARKSG